ncbi:hypothetical protein [Occultella gossypii]|uniref:ABC transporter permease n=1 Tax=Occultella gossypii TaxID=2800820 RepID=A0ABS7SE59_9MICO|nr:hypothetical protein [Occultella gossypii]MBZ2198644.1 hypothetical protein [Occultella gossypii]
MTTLAPAPDVDAPRLPAPPTPLRRVLALAFAVAAVVGVLVLAFSWPAVTAAPRDVPIAAVGPAPAVVALRATADEAQPGAVELIAATDRDAAVAAIEAREVYGAVVLGEQPEVLTSSAASQATHQLLTGIAGQIQDQLTAGAVAALQEAAAAGAPAADATLPTVTVTDVVPLSAEDPRGSGLAAAMFPLVLGGLAGGIAISLGVVGALRRVVAVVAYAGAGGLLLAGILQSWFGSLQGDWWVNAGVIALALGAIAAPITGLVAVLGRAGVALGAVLMMLVANPISGVAVPPEFLPWHWGAIGQWFPPGASGTLLRDVSYFPAADATAAWLALGLWAGVGVLLSLAGHVRTAARPPSTATAVGH